MKEYTFSITLEEFEVLEDVLSNIEEYRLYDSQEEEIDSLKKKFSYSTYKELRDGEKIWRKN